MGQSLRHGAVGVNMSAFRNDILVVGKLMRLWLLLPASIHKHRADCRGRAATTELVELYADDLTLRA